MFLMLLDRIDDDGHQLKTSLPAFLVEPLEVALLTQVN